MELANEIISRPISLVRSHWFPTANDLTARLSQKVDRGLNKKKKDVSDISLGERMLRPLR